LHLLESLRWVFFWLIFWLNRQFCLVFCGAFESSSNQALCIVLFELNGRGALLDFDSKWTNGTWNIVERSGGLLLNLTSPNYK
jgi:hypothetical protein